MKSKRSALYIPLVTAVFLFAGITGCTGEATQQQEAPSQLIKDVTPQEASALIDENIDNPDFVIVDVRTPDEFADGHIENAVNIDYNAGDFESEIITYDRDKTYLIYCRSGQRSRGALNIMAGLDFLQVYHLSEGILGWLAEGLPTVK